MTLKIKKNYSLNQSKRLANALVLSAPPKYPVSEAIGFLKIKRPMKVFDFNIVLKKHYWEPTFLDHGLLSECHQLDEGSGSFCISPTTRNLLIFIVKITIDFYLYSCYE